MDWYLRVLGQYAVFDGRARRKEYWFFYLGNLIIGAALVFLSLIVGPAIAVLSWIYSAAVLIPGLAVSVRRLHDTGRSGWYLFLGLIPFIGAVVIIVFMVQDSQPGDNQYGSNPKGEAILSESPKERKQQ